MKANTIDTDRVVPTTFRPWRRGDNYSAYPLHHATESEFLSLFLYHSGEHKDFLSESEHNKIFEAGDGYGKMSIAQLKKKGLTWDWSHIRDSSDEASAEMVRMIKAILVDNALRIRVNQLVDEVRRIKSERDNVIETRASLLKDPGSPALQHHFVNTVCG